MEGKENLQLKIETMPLEDLMRIIYRGESVPQDSRFLPKKEGGVFHYFDLPEILGTNRKEYVYFSVLKVGDIIVGIAEIEKDPYKENNFWIKQISVDPLYQGKGYASRLIEEIFNFAKTKEASLQSSIYSEEGKEKLEKVIQGFSEKTGVPLIKE